MAQVTDRTVGANPTGFNMRTELNNIIGALESDNSGSIEPLNTVPYMKWLDTSNATYYYYKERNHDNTAWVTLFRYTVATKIMEVVSNGTDLTTTLALKANLASPTFTGTVTAAALTTSGIVTLGGTTTAINIATAQTTGATIIGGTAQTGAITLGQSTGAQTVNVACAVTTTGVTKTVNIGTAGASGSTTNINIGSSTAGATTNVSAKGTFTFTTSPIVPTPTTDMQAANKLYVTNNAGISLATANSYDLGVGQTWQDVTASRVLGTTYTNSTGKPIMVIVSCTYTSGSSISLTIGGVLFYNKGTQAGVSLTASSDFIVPNGVTYLITMGNTAISKWMELR